MEEQNLIPENYGAGQEIPGEQEQFTAPKSSSGKGKWILGIVVLILLALGSVGYAYWDEIKEKLETRKLDMVATSLNDVKSVSFEGELDLFAQDPVASTNIEFDFKGIIDVYDKTEPKLDGEISMRILSPLFYTGADPMEASIGVRAVGDDMFLRLISIRGSGFEDLSTLIPRNTWLRLPNANEYESLFATQFIDTEEINRIVDRYREKIVEVIGNSHPFHTSSSDNSSSKSYDEKVSVRNFELDRPGFSDMIVNLIPVFLDMLTEVYENAGLDVEDFREDWDYDFDETEFRGELSELLDDIDLSGTITLGKKTNLPYDLEADISYYDAVGSQKVDMELTLDLDDYNKKFDISEPSDFMSYEEILEMTFSNSSANPFQQANDAQRRTNVLTYINAIDQYRADNEGSHPPGVTDTPTEVCRTDATDCTGLIDLSASVVPIYINELPLDPACPEQCAVNGTGYWVTINANGSTTVTAPLAELNSISVTR